MAVGVRLIAVSSPILSRALTANPRFFHPIPMPASTSFPSCFIHLRSELIPSFRQSCKRFVLAPHASLSSPNVPSRISESLNLEIFPSLDLTGLTPLHLQVLAILALALAVSKKVVHALLNPFFWLYFSWTWLFWPWILASSLAIYGLYSAYRHSIGLATVIEQLAVVTSVIAWLTIVPTAHFNGFLEGWPFVLFFFYHYFFFLESSVRKRLYGDLLPRDHDAKWDVDLPRPFRAAFFLLVLIGHWLAAFEGPELHMISGGWANIGT
ncbi:hypothetical protein HPP92_027965 [Vanilla planifolia]|uniref:Uncharacterized protein n=1 Tax=Vanilla planifolia TaxID=51239 RepID=A0A835U3J5_VANPL|nr:hypothetical protein HPP92_027965 [Vanilla planifolia]